MVARTPTMEGLAEIWRQALHLERIGAHDDFFGLGGDSLSAAQVVVEIQKTFGRTLPLTALHEAPTVEALAKVIDRHSNLASWPCVVGLQPLGLRPPFFCVHGAGGTVLGLTDLARHFAPHQPFYGIRAAGSEGYEQRFTCVEDIAAHYVQAIRAVQPEGPYYVGGYSFGGSVALEMAQQLHARGERVALLAILDHTPPPARYLYLSWTPTVVLDLALNAVRWFMEDIWRAGGARRLAALRSKACAAWHRTLNLLRRAAVSGEREVGEIFAGRALPEPFRQLLEKHYQAMRQYVPKVYAGRVTLFRARVRPLLRPRADDLGWGRLAGGGLEIIPVPGNHETMLKPLHVAELAEALSAQLTRAQTRSSHAIPRNGRSGENTTRTAAQPFQCETL
jgi:thioesterase domain-containing protein/acyl carrier protein